MVQNPTRTVSSSSDGGVKVKSSKNRKPAKRKSTSVVPILRTPPEPFACYFLLLSSVEDTTTLQHEDFQQQRD
jgi:hypothetical protein